MFEYDKHYQECRQQNKPFIKAKINPVHGNYYINVDLMTCNYIFTKKEQDEIEKLIQTEITFVSLNDSNLFNDYNINEEVVWIDGVSADHVDSICTSLFDLTQKYHN